MHPVFITSFCTQAAPTTIHPFVRFILRQMSNEKLPAAPRPQELKINRKNTSFPRVKLLNQELMNRFEVHGGQWDIKKLQVKNPFMRQRQG